MLEHLHFSYGGFAAGCTDIDITVKNGIVTAKVASIVNPDEIAPIHLSKKASQKWLAALDELKVTKWRAYYVPAGAMVLDGIQCPFPCLFQRKKGGLVMAVFVCRVREHKNITKNICYSGHFI